MNATYNFRWYYNDLQRFGDFLSAMNGVDASTLTVLHSDGSPPFQFANIPSPNVIAGTASALSSTLQSVAAAAVADDRFIFVASNHGGRDGTASYLWCWDERPLSAPSFAQACSRIACQRQAFVFGQCNSGGFIPALARSNRVILTGADLAGSTNQSDGDRYTEFLLRVVESLENGERRFAAVFVAAKAADTKPERPQLSDPGSVGSQDSLLNGP
jgi:hypothetical protein